MSFTELISLSLVMPVLLACSTIMVACAFERVWFFRKNGKIEDSFIKKVMVLIKTGRPEEALALCEAEKGVIPEILKSGITHFHLPRQDAYDSMETQKIRSETLLKKNFIVFGTLSFIAPLLGLLGTVLGIISAFSNIAVTGAGGPTVIASGISEALFTTAAGIIVAVPAAVIYNLLVNRSQDILNSAEAASRDILASRYGGNPVKTAESAL